MFNYKAQEALFLAICAKTVYCIIRAKGLISCGTPLEFFMVRNITGSCLNRSESVVENLQAIWP